MYRLRHHRVVGLVLAISTAITLLLWIHERHVYERDVRASLDFSLRETANRIVQRMATYEQVVRGVQSHFFVSNHVTQDDFRAYFDTLQSSADLSGIQGIGRAVAVGSDDLQVLTDTLRAEGLPDYRSYPSGESEYYAPVVQIEPRTGSNVAMLGFDPYADPARRKAMQRAADSGLPSITRKVRLATEREDSAEAGIVMYLPLYRRHAPVDDLVQRRAALVGWVFAYFRVNDLMASLYGERRSTIRVLLHDGIERTPENLLYDSGNVGEMASPMEATEYLSISGSTWSLTVQALPEFSGVAGGDQSTIILVAGLTLSGLLAIVVWQILAGRQIAFALARKMTEELRKSEERANHLAQHDVLTGLPNRALFLDRLAQAMSQARRNNRNLALLFIDLDSFKPINDRYGHGVGDALLQEVALRLREAIRESDSVGRMGGDEFVVLLPSVESDDDVHVVATKICDSLAKTFELDEKALSISASIGIALFPKDGSDEASLYKSADQAMYRAKADDGNRVKWAS